MKPTVIEVKHQIDTHEAVCAQRWAETIERIKRLEAGALAAMVSIIGLLLTIIGILLKTA